MSLAENKGPRGPGTAPQVQELGLLEISDERNCLTGLNRIKVVWFRLEVGKVRKQKETWVRNGMGHRTFGAPDGGPSIVASPIKRKANLKLICS